MRLNSQLKEQTGAALDDTKQKIDEISAELQTMVSDGIVQLGEHLDAFGQRMSEYDVDDILCLITACDEPEPTTQQAPATAVNE